MWLIRYEDELFVNAKYLSHVKIINDSDIRFWLTADPDCHKVAKKYIKTFLSRLEDLNENPIYEIEAAFKDMEKDND